jgi:CheY-like chemotaxis protein
MSPSFPSQRLEDLRDDARLLIEQADNQEARLGALVAATDSDERHAEAALAHSADLGVDEIQQLLSQQLQRSAAGAVSTKRLWVEAHQHHADARRLLVHLDGYQIPGRPGPNTVLVVDDYGDVRELVARVLEHAGFVVRTAGDGLEGLIAAHQMRPRVILMDVSMPVLDGIEATRLIKAGEETRDARVIAHTGNSSFGDSPARTLFAAVLSKPATPEDILATVQRVAGL